MALNPNFTESGGLSTQQSLYENLVIEALKIYGQNYHYVPREIVTKDDIFGEDIFSKFKNSLPIEMYIENKTGFDSGDIFQKFGVEIRDEATFVVAKSRWESVVSQGFLPSATNRIEALDRGGNIIKSRALGPEGSSVVLLREDSNSNKEDPVLSGTNIEEFSRPREGDLIFMPSTNTIFEITFVEHEKPFYQLNNLPVYKLSASLFEYSGEEMDLDDIGIDEHKFATEYILTVDSVTGFTNGELISQTVGSNTVTAEIQKLSNGNNVNLIHVSNVRNQTDKFVTFSAGSITGKTSGQTATILSISENNNTGYSSNDAIESIADSITAFDSTNPFGDF
jgi:hypothetical protein